MEIRRIRTLAGPNVFHHKPVLMMELALKDLNIESRDIPGFNQRLQSLLPGLSEHRCSLGRPGGFIERLERGTYFGHVVEHVALGLTDAAGIPASYGKTVGTDEPDVYLVVVEYQSEQGMRELLRIAVDLVQALIDGQSFPLEERLARARAIVADTALGPSGRSIVEVAAQRGIPWRRLTDNSLVQLGYGRHRTFVQAAVTSRTSSIAVEAAQNKELTKRLLAGMGIPVPEGYSVVTEPEAAAAFAELGPSVAIKPLDANQGKGISLNVVDEQQASAAFRLAQQYGHRVLIERYVTGRDYRVLIVNGNMVAASERKPPTVTGDGIQTIAQLIDRENSNPLRGEGHEKPLTRLKVDAGMLACLERRGLTLQHVPKAGEPVVLRETGNLSTGGTAIDVTDRVHQDIALLCARAASIIGLDVCGVDLVKADIATPPDGREAILGVNAGPGLRMHLFPSEGTPRDVAGPIVEMLYPSGHNGRVPIISVTGTNGKTTTSRMIGHVLAAHGYTVGLVATGGIFIGGRCVQTGDTTGPGSAELVLSDPTVDIAVLETARGGIARRGLGYDWADIAVITNIEAGHIGQKRIHSIEDIVHIKSVVAERVREGGVLVLNADSQPVAGLLHAPRVRRLPKSFVLFSLTAHHPLLEEQAAQGATVYFLNNGWIYEGVGSAVRQVVHVSDLPSTFNGAAEFQVANTMAALAACRAAGLKMPQVVRALETFAPSDQNPGRANLYAVRGGHVLVDFGHNPGAFEAIGRVAAHWRGRRITAVISLPGDRADELIESAGRAAAHAFDRVIIRSDKDLRNRTRGEVPRLLARTVQQAVPECECRVILDEREAVTTALNDLGPGEFVVVIYDDLPLVMNILDQFGASPIDGVQEYPIAV